MRFKLGSVYFAALGVIMLVFGGLEFVTGLPGIDITLSAGALVILDDVWRGIILFSAGAFIIAGSFKLRDIHGLGMTVLGSIMLWIVAGCEIFARITECAFESPYCPSLWLLPFSLVIIYFMKSR